MAKHETNIGDDEDGISKTRLCNLLGIEDIVYPVLPGKSPDVLHNPMSHSPEQCGTPPGEPLHLLCPSRCSFIALIFGDKMTQT